MECAPSVVRWDALVSASWELSSVPNLESIAVHASVPAGQQDQEAPATFQPPGGSTARCEVAVDLTGHPEVRALQISSNARICEVSVASAGQPPSYVGTVRATPAVGMAGVHTLHVVVPGGSACRLLLKMLSLAEKARWHLHRLAFVTEAPPSVDEGNATGSAEQVHPNTRRPAASGLRASNSFDLSWSELHEQLCQAHY